jgi:uncharacterized damage-inducible protein DinB
MSEIERIARLFVQTFEGKPYYGPSLLDALEGVTAEIAFQQAPWSAHSIWSLVTHLTAELIYARKVLEGSAAPDDGKTWLEILEPSDAAWENAIQELKRAHRSLVRSMRKLDDRVLDQKPTQVRGPYYQMLHGILQHNIYHVGQISLLTGQINTNKAK